MATYAGALYFVSGKIDVDESNIIAENMATQYGGVAIDFSNATVSDEIAGLSGTNFDLTNNQTVYENQTFTKNNIFKQTPYHYEFNIYTLNVTLGILDC